MAIEEAFLAEQGFTEKLIQDINMAAGNPTFDESVYRWLQEATGSNQDQDFQSPNQASFFCMPPHFLSSLNSPHLFSFSLSSLMVRIKSLKYDAKRLCQVSW